MECCRFSDWMRLALHDPAHGYYASQVRTVGRVGDFSTSATISGVLGDAIAHWLLGACKGQRRIRTVIEVGGGEGALSARVRRTLGWWRRRALHWLMVETSPRLRAQQEAALGTQGVCWFESMQDAMRECDGLAFIFHNELVDTFPVRLLQWSQARAQWQEVWLQRESGAWTEVLRPAGLSDDEVLAHVALTAEHWTTVPLCDGQRIEIHADYRRWLRTWAGEWRAGAMLTVDYGDVFPRLYHRRPRGTLRACFHHQRLTGTEVYANMGRQDITADVNFSDLTSWGREAGWETVSLQTQREFFHRHARQIQARPARNAGTTFLTDEHGAGSAFKVLEQRPPGA